MQDELDNRGGDARLGAVEGPPRTDEDKEVNPDIPLAMDSRGRPIPSEVVSLFTSKDIDDPFNISMSKVKDIDAQIASTFLQP